MGEEISGNLNQEIDDDGTDASKHHRIICADHFKNTV
jgi:hypothetical protein